MQAPVALTDAQVVLLIVIAKVVQVKVEGLGDAVSGTRERVLFGHDIHLTKNWNLDVSNQYIGAKEGGAA